ncbi:MAG: FAD-dependent oxidoreductase [Phycisphaerae bacterium]|nr:FAD-dependent oxidoreductase [Phycisphaerae bacterium]
MPSKLDRRTFLKTGAAAAVALPSYASAPAAAKDDTPMKAYREPARDVPVVEHADVVVCGGGPAGVAAAVAAARSGAKTRLLETNGCLGGIWTAGLLSWILDAGNKTGLMPKLLAELRRRAAPTQSPSPSAYDVEQMKLLLEEWCAAAGVNLQLHTRVVSAARDESKALSLAITESKSGRQAWSAKVFVDATGDGDLAALAGCGFDYGQRGAGLVQPMSMIVLLTGLDPKAVAPFVRNLVTSKDGNPKKRLFDELNKAGVCPSYAQPTLFYIRDDLFCFMANHEYNVSAMDAAQITQATLRARVEVHKLVDALRGLGDPWQRVRIVVTPEHIGVREGRRIHGRYCVTEQDLATGAEQPDAVCKVRFPVDVHSPDPHKTKGIAKARVRAKPYDIPYRALQAKDAPNLLMAGRCISGDFIAHSSYRVTGNAVPMGEAAGTAAALAARSNRSPVDVPWEDIRRAMDAADHG